MVDFDGKNRYPNDENWLTDGYGDFVRHYLRAMAALPELSPSDEEHILSSTSVIQRVEYKNQIAGNPDQDNHNSDHKNIGLRYTAYDKKGTEQLRLMTKPTQILLGRKTISETATIGAEGYLWKPLKVGGILTINRINANEVTIIN